MFLFNVGSLQSVLLPDSITSFGEYTLAYCSGNSFTQFIWPASIATIGGGAFLSSNTILVHDFRKALQVPTIQNSTFSGINPNCQIVVPDALYADWIVAQYWTNFASKIVKESDYTP